MKPQRDTVLDELLIFRVQSGDAAALELLARRWHGRLFRHACRLTRERDAASDALQEAWLAIARGLPRLQDPARFPGWAHRIVANKCRDWLRKLERRRRLRSEVAREPRQETVAPRTSARPVDPAAEPRVGALRAALAELPEDRRTLLSLFYLEELSVEQIATALDLPPGTVKSRLFYARRTLREQLTESADPTA